MTPLSITQLPPDLSGLALPEEALEVPLQEPSSLDFSGAADNVEELEDGSAVFTTSEAADPLADAEFNANLAELLPRHELSRIGSEIFELVEKDVANREGRDKQYKEGIQRTGLGDEPLGGADFVGASRVVHPMLARGCVDFSSRAIKELMPAAGPCRTLILGESNDAKLEKADRKRKFMNWQLTTQVSENRSELEKLLSQVPLGGCQYKRWWWDAELGRPRTEAVFIDNVFVPYGYSDFYTTPRVAHRQNIPEQEFERRVRNGLYCELGLGDAGSLASISGAAEATDKITGVEADSAAYSEEGLRTVWEIFLDLEVEDDPLTEGALAPYVLHLDHTTTRPLGLFRNWREDDQRRRRIHWMSEWAFIPWRGGPAIGLAQLMGSMSTAATGALRALLDSAHIQNFPGAVKLKGGRNAGQDVTLQATQVHELEAPPGTDDIRKLIMPLPFNQPSSVLFQLMEWLTQQAEQVISTASEKIADAGANMPVGTAMALIEHGAVNFSAIHSRLHQALRRDMEILHRLNAENLDEAELGEDIEDFKVTRADFAGPMDVMPVSDPNIFSEAQRYAQLQAVLQLKADPTFAPFFKPERLLSRALKLLQIPDLDDLADLPKETKNLSALEENYALANDQQPLKAYRNQNHLAHLQVHIQFGLSPMFGANPLVGTTVVAPLTQHCREHLLALYRDHSEGALEAMMLVSRAQGTDLDRDTLEAQAVSFIDYALAQVLGAMVMPGLEKLQALAGSYGPKPTASPELQAQLANALELKRLEITSREKIETSKENSEITKLQAAAEIEKQDRHANARLADLAASVQLMRDQQKAGADQLMAQFSAQQEKQTLVLQTLLNAAQPAAQPMILPDLTQMLNGVGAALSDGLGTAITGLSAQQQQFSQAAAEEALVTRRAMENLYAGLGSLERAALTPREGRIIRDADGVRVISTPRKE
jgi:hypothetical protein